MSEKPEALRLAQELDVASLGIRGCLEALSADAMLRQHAEIERLKADNEALRRDAERYRWLRGEDSRIDPCIKANAKYKLERQSITWVEIHDLDAAIDAAMEDKR
jgi:hypothetical protein